MEKIRLGPIFGDLAVSRTLGDLDDTSPTLGDLAASIILGTGKSRARRGTRVMGREVLAERLRDGGNLVADIDTVMDALGKFIGVKRQDMKRAPRGLEPALH